MTAAAETPDVGPDWLAGRALLEHHARTGRVFDANLIRAELRELGFGRFSSGLLFRQAHEQGVIRRVGIDVSTDKPTRGAFVRRWQGVEHRGGLESLIPVRRDHDGKFTSTATPSPTADGPTLLTFMEQS